MPIYEYQCSDCTNQFEELIRLAGQEKKLTCPQCGGKHVHRRLSVFAARGGGGDAGACPGLASAGPQACASCSSPDGNCPFN